MAAKVSSLPTELTPEEETETETETELAPETQPVVPQQADLAACNRQLLDSWTAEKSNDGL